MRLGASEMIVILVIALLVFGPNKLPQLGDALGKGIRNFKQATEGAMEPDPVHEVAALPPHAPPSRTVASAATVEQRVA